MRLRYALAAAVCFCALGSLRADERTDLEVRGEVRRQLEALGSSDPSARQGAVEALVDLGPAAKPYLQDALASLDPDVRFYVLFVLQADDVRVERLVRQIVEGHSEDSGTYPSALEARRELIGLQSSGKLTMLARIARRYGSDSGKRRNGRYVVTSLDLLWELLEKTPAEQVPAELPALMARLCELDLGDGFHDLAHAFAFLPPETAQRVLREQIADGRPLARVRAARVLAEFVSAEAAPEAVAWVAPLLGDDDPRLREGALIALDVMPLKDEHMAPVLGLLSDRAPEVASEALRIAGERGLAFARQPAENVATDPARPLSVRLEAVRTLGLIGDPASAPGLRALADPVASGKELAILAHWALGAVGGEKAAEGILSLVQTRYPQEDPLYFGLSRLGGVDGLGALDALLARGLDIGRVVSAYTRCVKDRALAITEVREFASTARAGHFQLAAQALSDMAADFDQPNAAAREHALQSLARLYLTSGNDQQRDILLPILSRVGGPRDPLLKAQLAQKLVGSITSPRLTRMRRENAADALARVDAAQALAAIRSQLASAAAGRSDSMRDYARSLVRSMARAGDSSKVIELALPYSRKQVDEAQPDQRAWRQNDVGIDLLYAKQLDNAILEFRRMIWCRAQDYIASYNIACGYSLAGEVDEALRYLRRSVRHGYDDPRHMRTDTDLTSLHGDPRFQRLVRRMFLQEETGLPRPDESWPRNPSDD
jgi:HEAT repeat protein